MSPETVNLKAGETTDISVSAVTGSGRTANSLALDWSSSAPEIAIVSQNGVVSGVSAGEAVITASTGQVSRTAQVDVSNADSTASTISPTPSGPAIAHSPELDFDGTAVLGVEHPWGIWSDGTTLWVSYYWNEHKIYAFNWASGARVPNQDFDSLDAAGNRNPRGIWSDGETMWVADHDDDKLYAYSMATKERQPGKDLLLAPSNNVVQGIWSDGTTMWASDLEDHKLYAYDMATKDWKPFSDIPANFRPTGLWSDGETIWAGELDFSKIFAFDIATREHDASKDFDTLLAAGNERPVGLWSNGESLWVVDVVDLKIYAYNMPPGTGIASVATTPTGTAFARNPAQDFNELASDGVQGVEGIWSDGTTLWVSDEITGKVFAYDLKSKERVPGEDFDTLRAAGNSHPEALWSDGKTMYVADSVEGRVEIGGKVYAFDLEAKAHIPGEDFDTLKVAGNRLPRGIWSDGSTMWVGDDPDGKIYAYDTDRKTRTPDRDFNTLNAAGNGHPEGLWSDGETMWVADYDTRKIYAYDMATKQHIPSKDFNTLDASGNSNPGGLWSDGATMWVADVADGKIYAYHMPLD